MLHYKIITKHTARSHPSILFTRQNQDTHFWPTFCLKCLTKPHHMSEVTIQHHYYIIIRSAATSSSSFASSELALIVFGWAKAYRIQPHTRIYIYNILLHY